MPRTRRAYLVRRMQQADKSLQRVMGHMASIWCTLITQHPDMGPWILDYIDELDKMRVKLHYWHCYGFRGRKNYLWQPGDKERILAEAKPVPDPKRK